MNHNLKEVMLPDCYEYSLGDVAEKLFMHINTARRVEKEAIAKFKAEFMARGFRLEDFV